MTNVTNKPWCMGSIVVLSVIFPNVVAPCCMSGCSAAVFASSVTEKKSFEEKREGGEKKKSWSKLRFASGNVERKKERWGWNARRNPSSVLAFQL